MLLERIIETLSVLIAILIISWVGSFAFTGEKSENSFTISNKKWKTF